MEKTRRMRTGIRQKEKVKAKELAIKIGISAGAAFLLGRALFYGEGFCGAIAFITVMMSIDSIFIYTLPVIWLAMYSLDNYLIIWGDFGAVVLIALVSAYMGKHRFTMVQRGMIAIASFVIANCAYYIIQEKVYMFDGLLMAKEALIIGGLVYMFDSVAKGVYGKREDTPICFMGGGILLMLSGIGVTPVLIGGGILLLIPILFCEEIKDGVETATVFGFIALTTTSEEYMITLVSYLIISTLICGFISRYMPSNVRKPVITLVMTVGLCMVEGINKYFLMILAGAIILIPDQPFLRVWHSLKRIFGVKNDTSWNLTSREIKETLESNRENYRTLSKLFADVGDDRQVLSYQFSAMERVMNSAIKELDDRKKTGLKSVKVRTTLGWGTYAGGEVSGDSYLCKTLSCGKTLMLLSDGMGKGSRAALESKLVVTTIGKMIESGTDPNLAMKTVNATMLNKSNDIFATVDLVLIDEFSGTCRIYKMGAAATVVKREGKVAELRRSSLPAGIQKESTIEEASFKVKEGDIIVMISDGVIDCDHNDGKGQWLLDRLESISTRDPDTIAQLIINKAVEKYGIRERDDLTVLVASIYQ